MGNRIENLEYCIFLADGKSLTPRFLCRQTGSSPKSENGLPTRPENCPLIEEAVNTHCQVLNSNLLNTAKPGKYIRIIPQYRGLVLG
jgi:hypothetical protein